MIFCSSWGSGLVRALSCRDVNILDSFDESCGPAISETTPVGLQTIADGQEYLLCCPLRSTLRRYAAHHTEVETVSVHQPDFSVEADAQRHQSPCSDRRPDGRRKNEMKDRQPCQSVAEARLSVGSAIAAPAITISLKSSLSTARQHRREEPKAASYKD